MSSDGGKIILAFESSGGKASAAVGRGGAVLARRDHFARHGHAAWMLTLARDVLADAGITPRQCPTQCEAILAGRGPGSFTGIRIALAAAKGMGLAWGCPVFGLSSLESMASAAADGEHPVAAIADSRRGSLFVEMFSADGRAKAPPCDMPPDAVLSALQQNGEDWIITGHIGGIAVRGACGLHGVVEAEPDAGDLCLLFNRIDAGRRGDLPPEPLYLAPPLLGPTRS